MKSEQPTVNATSTPPAARTHPVKIGLLAALSIGVIVGGVFITRAAHSAEVRQRTEQRATPTVETVRPEPSEQADELVLPAQLQAFTRAPIHAQVGGYLASWEVDIGAKVKSGDLLATIATPELTQELLEAKAEVATAQAQAELAQRTAERWTNMADSDAVSAQAVDEKRGMYEARRAQLNVAQAKLERLQAQASFSRLNAPFTGLVTARNVDVGALVVAGEQAGPPLFEVSDTSRLRAYVRVPQAWTPDVKVGDSAELAVVEYPGERFTAEVKARSEAVDQDSGTLLVQLWVDNAQGRLLPGSYAEIMFKLPPSAAGLVIPAGALVFDAQGLQVVTIDDDQRAHFQKVKVGRDYGKQVEVVQGLQRTSRLVASPPDGLTDGALVHTRSARKDGKQRHTGDKS